MYAWSVEGKIDMHISMGPSHLCIFQHCYVCLGDFADEFIGLEGIIKKTAASAMAAMKGLPLVGNIQTLFSSCFFSGMRLTSSRW